MAYGSSMMMKPPMKPPAKKSGMKKPEMKPLRGLTLAQTKKLMEHSKMHKGGMNGKHMKNMVKFMRAGDTFAKAHNKAKKLDEKKM
tara:strand:+ start:2823 stop:3080 length:258 start_codon:yes stop_codon:yes gene_type:complete